MEIAEIAGYRVIRRLGAGGMGQVFLVQHPRLPRRDALKLLDAGVSRNGDFKARFQREADLLAQLSHPNIVTLYDRGEFDGRLWISMEFIDGIDAGELLTTRGPVPLEQALTLIDGAGAALDYAWRKQRITHRDVKPANILLALDESDGAVRIESVKLADFGIAKAAGESTSLTSTGMTVGTMSYISPEAIEGEDVDNRSDVYSLGCTAFHLLTGRPPFAGKSMASVVSAHLTQEPPAITSVASGLPVELNAVFARVLAKNPDHRYQSCGEFVAGLRAAGGASAEAGASASPNGVAPIAAPTVIRHPVTPPTTSSTPPAGGRSWGQIGLVAAIVLLVVIAGALGIGLATRSSSGPVPEAAAASSPVMAATSPRPSASASTVQTVTATVTPTTTEVPITTTTEIPITTTTPPAGSESKFLKATRTLPMYVLPNGRYTTDAQMLAGGYRACALLDQYPTDSMAATRAYFPQADRITYEEQMFVLYSASYLCPRHAHLYENF